MLHKRFDFKNYSLKQKWFLTNVSQLLKKHAQLSTWLLITYELIIDSLWVDIVTYESSIEFSNFINLPWWPNYHPNRLSILKHQPYLLFF
jgi:hypothetical protein